MHDTVQFVEHPAEVNAIQRCKRSHHKAKKSCCQGAPMRFSHGRDYHIANRPTGKYADKTRQHVHFDQHEQ